MKELEWNGFKRLDFDFNGRRAILVIPINPHPEGKWCIKTEYFGAFPELELELRILFRIYFKYYALEYGRGPRRPKRIYQLSSLRLWIKKPMPAYRHELRRTARRRNGCKASGKRFGALSGRARAQSFKLPRRIGNFHMPVLGRILRGKGNEHVRAYML